MRILNVTPDSFFDGGYWSSSDMAIERAVQMTDKGADLINIGGESTRPNSTRVSEEKERSRISTALYALIDQGVACLVDTLYATAVLRAADAGAAIINNISGGRWGPQMNAVLARTGLAYAVQYYRTLLGMSGKSFDYGGDPMGTLKERVNAQARDALDTGVAPETIIIDPGPGFLLTSEQCHTVLDGLSILSSLGYPVLVGASRKHFIAAMGDDRDE